MYYKIIQRKMGLASFRRSGVLLRSKSSFPRKEEPSLKEFKRDLEKVKETMDEHFKLMDKHFKSIDDHFRRINCHIMIVVFGLGGMIIASIIRVCSDEWRAKKSDGRIE